MCDNTSSNFQNSPYEKGYFEKNEIHLVLLHFQKADFEIFFLRFY